MKTAGRWFPLKTRMAETSFLPSDALRRASPCAGRSRHRSCPCDGAKIGSSIDMPQPDAQTSRRKHWRR